MTVKNTYIGPSQVVAYDGNATYTDDGLPLRGIRADNVRLDVAPTQPYDAVRLEDLQAAVILNGGLNSGGTGAQPDPDETNAGTLYFNTDTNTLEYSDGTNWLPLSLTNLGSGDFVDRPAFGHAGNFYWSSDKKVLSFDTGLAWYNIGTIIYGRNIDIGNYPAGILGRFYFASDQFIMYFDNGTSWQFVSSIIPVPEANKLPAVGNLGLFQFTLDTHRFFTSDGTAYIRIGTIDDGVYASRPAAGYQGRFYLANDVGLGSAGILYYDNGSSWLEVTPHTLLRLAGSVATILTVERDAAGTDPQIIDLIRNNGTGNHANADFLTQLSFNGYNSVDTKTLFAKITAQVQTVTSTLEIGRLVYSVPISGTMRDIMYHDGSGTTCAFGHLNVLDGLRITKDTGYSGLATLVGGTKLVNTSKVRTVGTNCAIQLTRQTLGGTAGHLSITANVDGTSFTIGSSNASDTSTVFWNIIEID